MTETCLSLSQQGLYYKDSSCLSCGDREQEGIQEVGESLLCKYEVLSSKRHLDSFSPYWHLTTMRTFSALKVHVSEKNIHFIALTMTCFAFYCLKRDQLFHGFTFKVLGKRLWLASLCSAWSNQMLPSHSAHHGHWGLHFIRGAQIVFAEKHWLLTWIQKLAKNRRSLASLPPFVSAFALSHSLCNRFAICKEI
jgi:hypothetical protein